MWPGSTQRSSGRVYGGRPEALDLSARHNPDARFLARECKGRPEND
jgi:hypothetical protein